MRLLAVLLLGSGCGGAVIPNTEVADTSENREIVQFVERYRRAVEQRDVAGLLALASTQYLDDSGTPDGADDMDFEGLRTKLAAWSDSVLDVRYEIRYRRVSHSRNRILVDYTYTGSFHLTSPEGDDWSRRLADNRLVLVRQGDDFRILSGM